MRANAKMPPSHCFHAHAIVNNVDKKNKDASSITCAVYPSILGKPSSILFFIPEEPPASQATNPLLTHTERVVVVPWTWDMLLRCIVQLNMHATLVVS
jgi:hypothetical protein